jgi:hypothetical protein
MHNIIEAADTSVLLYYHATAVVRNHVFIDSSNGVTTSRGPGFRDVAARDYLSDRPGTGNSAAARPGRGVVRT